MTKKKRAQKRKNTNNETPLAADSKENTPAIQTEKGATAMFAEAKSVSPKRVVPHVHDFDDKNTEDSKQHSLPAEICSSVTDLQPQGTSSADELMLLKLMYLNWIYKKMMENDFVMHEPCDLDLIAFECSNSSNSVVIDVDVAEDQRICAHKEDPGVENIQDLVTPNNVAVPANQDVTMAIEENADQEVNAAQNQEATISEEVNDSEKNILEAFVHRRNSVAVHGNEETATATKPTAEGLYPTHDAVSANVVTSEVKRQLQTIKEIIEDVLNLVNAKDPQHGKFDGFSDLISPFFYLEIEKK